MGLFTRYAMDALMKTSHPEVIRRQCWNLHPHRTPCTACKDICPYGDAIFTRPNLVKDWDPCTDCGLCVSVCRSGCIVPSPEQVQRDTSLADTDNDTLWLGCEKSTRKNTAVRTCIASFSWETLAYLALNKKLVLDLTPCGECENDVCAAQLRKELTRLVEFLGPQLFESRVTLAYQQEDAPYHVQELSRREMFSHMTEGSRAGTKKLLQMLPGLRSEEDSGVDFRLLLHQRTKQLKAAMETPLQYGYYMPKFTDNCFGCGRCEKACRANAMKFEDMPNGQTRIVLTPWKCSECGVCMNVCSNKGFDGMKLYQLTTLGPVVLHKCTKTPKHRRRRTDMLNIDEIQNGIVIDHIKAGTAVGLMDLLGIAGNRTASVALIQNARSKKTASGRKDIIKIDREMELDWDLIGYVDPSITVNSIRDGQLVEKRTLKLPERIRGVLRCKNPRCITSVEQELPQEFVLTDQEKRVYRCIYCETQAEK